MIQPRNHLPNLGDYRPKAGLGTCDWCNTRHATLKATLWDVQTGLPTEYSLCEKCREKFAGEYQPMPRHERRQLERYLDAEQRRINKRKQRKHDKAQ